MIERIKTAFRLNTMITVLSILMAIALQIQASFFAHGNYKGLRVNLADFLLPFAGLYILYTLLTRRSFWPRWCMRYIIPGLLGLLGVMTIALLNGYVHNGFFSSWALINKYIGFIILLCYFFLGSWITANTPKKVSQHFAKYFCAFFIITLAASFICVLLQPFVPFDLWLSDPPCSGFMANRNVFMVLCVFVVLLMETYRHASLKGRFLPSWSYALFWGLIPFFVICNASRTGWIIGTLVLFALLLQKTARFFRFILPCLFIGGVLFFTALHVVNYLHRPKDGEIIASQQAGSQIKNLISVLNDHVQYTGDQVRIIELEDATQLYKKVNPILGAGLGAYKQFQIQKRGTFIDIIDCTPLWLLVETGALGLLAFSLFFVACLWTLFRSAFSKHKQDSSEFQRALFLFLILIITISFLHELLYTRFLWFALGLGLAVPIRNISITN